MQADLTVRLRVLAKSQKLILRLRQQRLSQLRRLNQLMTIYRPTLREERPESSAEGGIAIDAASDFRRSIMSQASGLACRIGRHIALWPCLIPCLHLSPPSWRNL